MRREDLPARISMDPNVCFSKPCARGRRIWVSLVLDFLAAGTSIEEIMQEYDLEKDDVLACIAYGAEVARQRLVKNAVRPIGELGVAWARLVRLSPVTGVFERTAPPFRLAAAPLRPRRRGEPVRCSRTCSG